MQKLKNLQQVLCKYYSRVTWYSQQKQMNLNQNQTIFYEKELSLKQLIDQGCCCNCCYCYCSYLVAAITTTTIVLSIRQSYFLCFSLGYFHPNNIKISYSNQPKKQIIFFIISYCFDINEEADVEGDPIGLLAFFNPRAVVCWLFAVVGVFIISLCLLLPPTPGFEVYL